MNADKSKGFSIFHFYRDIPLLRRLFTNSHLQLIEVSLYINKII